MRAIYMTVSQNCESRETPSTYRTSAAEMAAPVPRVEAVLFDFSNTIFQMIDLETWLHRIGDASGRLAALEEPGALTEISRQLRDAFQLPAVVALQKLHTPFTKGADQWPVLLYF